MSARLASFTVLCLCCLVAAAVMAGPAHALLRFERSTIDVGTGGVKGVGLGDVNGDGHLDLVTRNVFAYVAVALGRGDGTFGTPRRYVDDAEMMVVKDVSRDHLADVVTLDGERIWVRLGRRDGRLGARKGWLAGRNCRGLAVADVTRDGRQDLVVTDARAKRVLVLAGRGDGTFRAPVGYACGSDPRGVAVGDVNGDRRPDIVVANYAATRVGVLLASRSGFGVRKTYPVNATVDGLRPVAVALGDANGDGDLDILVSTEYMPGVSLLTGDGAGHFTPRSLPIPYRPVVGFTTGDVNGDGDLDVIALSGPSLVVVPGVGSGEFRGPQSYEWADGMAGQGHKIGGVAVGDVDGDGRQDVAAVSGFWGDVASVCVFRNTGVGATSSYSQFWPDPGSVVNALKVYDMDGDGRPDVVMPALGGLAVNYGAGDGTLAQRITLNDAAYDVVAAKFDAGDSLDLAYTTLGHVGVALGGGGRSFQPMASYTDSHPPVYLAAGDLDGDGRADLAVASGNYDNSISVRVNDGSGSFGAETVYAAFGPPNDLEIADMDGDGKRDVIVASGGRISIFPGDGKGALGTRRDYDAGTLATQLRIADLNGDGKPDVVTDGVAVLFNEGAGTLGAPTVVAAGSSVDVADVDGDGALDIVSSVGDEFEAQLGNGQGDFTTVETQGTTGLLEVADFNGDGKQDVCVCNQIGVGGVLVYLGTGEW